MKLTSTDQPQGLDESSLASMPMAPSYVAKPQRVASTPVSLECRALHWFEAGRHEVAILAEVFQEHVTDEILIDRARVTIDLPAMKRIARLRGAGWYSRQTDNFDMLRPQW